jgi:uncharacterized repeat protein (TIGR03803 family)
MKKTLFILASVFCLNANAQYTKLLDFTGTANGLNPSYSNAFISDGTFLYGMAGGGGANGMGLIYKMMPNGSGFVDLYDFAGTTNGKGATGTLFYDGTFMYGMTVKGGTVDSGVVFKIKPDGSSYAKLIDLNNTTGGNPYGSLFSDGTFLYGTTASGGLHNYGTLFKIMPNGSGFVKLHDFANGSEGAYPYGSLISDGTYLYGMTSSGGANSIYGSIFKIKPDGSGFTTIYSFGNGGAVNGMSPIGSLISVGGALYGMTRNGGANSHGLIFKIMPDGSGYTKLLDFAGPNTPWGDSPYGDLIYDGTFFYGMTQKGGATSSGTIFKIKPDGSGYVDLFDFVTGTTTGKYPYGTLYSDGSCLYGTTYNGGSINAGTVFSLCGALGGIIEEKTNHEQIIVYPNPANNKIIIQANQITDVKLLDLLGKQITNTKANDVDVSNLINGIYFVQVQTNNSNYIQKIIVQH